MILFSDSGIMLHLSDRSFKSDLKQALRLYGKFHRQLVHHLFGISVYDQSHRLFSGDAALVAVEQLILADF